MLEWALLTLISTQLLIAVHGSTKKGVVHMGLDYLCNDFDVLNVSWWYDYTDKLSYFESFEEQKGCVKRLASYQEYNTFVPMVAKSLQGINQVSDGDAYCLSMNEPNHKLQSNLTAAQAAAMWPELKNKANGKSIECPSASVCGKDCITPTAEEWLDEFFALTGENSCEYLVVHTFSSNVEQIMTTLEGLCTRYNKQVWLNEFASSEFDDPLLMKLFMMKILPLLDQSECVFRFSWYKGRLVSSTDYVPPSASLLEPNEPKLTALGQVYAGYQGGPIPLPAYSELQFDEPMTPMMALAGVSKEEVLFVMEHYTKNPSEWFLILVPVTWNLGRLPASAQAFYLLSDKKAQKARIKGFFNIVMCATEGQIGDQEVWDEIQRITILEEVILETKVGNLKVPTCV